MALHLAMPAIPPLDRGETCEKPPRLVEGAIRRTIQSVIKDFTRDNDGPSGV